MYLGRNPAVGTQKMLDSLESQFNGTLTTFDLRYGGVPTYPTLSESLIVSLGGVLQEPGEAYYVSSDKIVFSEAPNAGTECWILLYSQYGAATSATPSLAIQATGEPMGFENRTHSSISFNNGSRTFSIAPNTGGGYSSYAVWTKGTKRTISATLSVQVGTSTGLYYIYFDAFGDLQYKTTYFTWDTETPVAYVYWNSATSSAPFVADERHGVVLDWQTHEYLHRTRGAVIAEGFSISAYTTTGNGSADAHAKFDMGNGTFFDEDLEVNITHSATPVVGTFTQVLTGGAEIPVFYMSGSAGAWVRDPATKYACKQSATTLQYNLLSGSTWSTAAADNNRYVVSWIVATNDITAPIICILGQGQYTAIGTAEEAKFGELVLTNFPIVEFRPLWKVIFQTSTGFTNVPNALIANILDLRHYSESSISGTIISDHGLLSGLADDDHSQYIHTSLDRAGVTSNISTTGNLGGANLTLTGELRGPASFVIDPAAVGDNTGTVVIKGDLQVDGTTTTINSTTLTVDDKNITIADGASTLANIDTAGIDFGSTAVRVRYNYNAGTNSGLSIEGANVGIGITVPLTKLHVVSADPEVLLVERSGNANALIQYKNTDGVMYAGLTSSATGWGVDDDNNVGNGPMFFVSRATGNVGIATNSPVTPLHVSDGTSGVISTALYTSDYVTISAQATAPGFNIISANNSSVGGRGVFKATRSRGTLDTPLVPLANDDVFSLLGAVYDSSAAALATAAINLNVDGTVSAGVAPQRISFWTGTTNTRLERMRITSAGLVGIGVTNPVAKFQINTQDGFRFDVGANAYSYMQFGSAAAAEGTAEIGFERTTGNIYIKRGTPSSLSTALTIDVNGNVGIGTTNPGYKLQVVGSFAATTKSFVIPHPTREGYRLRYGSLEGPENGVYVRGRSTDSVIELPEYWVKLVDEDSITVSLAPIGSSGAPRVEKIEGNKVYVFTKDQEPLEYFYTVFAERIDVDKLEVETEVG